ncbi:MAG TPA: HAMP domain-containing sensor histidine kinase [Ramlibacter sp.]|nr:HAMP domain-containing sensor histidine kinase [Ramlibacter sp.]
MSHLVLQWLKEEVVTAPYVPVLHPSPVRMKGLGLFTLFGHPLFWFVWAVWLPQPYENLPLRLFTASLGFLLINDRVSKDPTSRFSGQVFTAVFWFELPFLFTWMYLCNGGNHAWLASMAAMILTYYFSTDWRLATIGIALGGLLARVLFEFIGPATAPWPPELFWTNTMVLAFCVSMGMLLGLSTANLRREHLSHTLATMGIMAHELRTPLATMALIGDAVRGSAADCEPEAAHKLEQLASRLHMLVRNMNHQIDMQIANARLTRLPARTESVVASDLVRTAVLNYPFRTTREKECARVTVHADFIFRGSYPLFSQVIDNLIKNALRSLAAGSSAMNAGDLVIEVGVQHDRGRVVIADRGIGIDPELQRRIFEPFFSTNRGTGHGLGLAFCNQVVHAARGTLRVKSAPGQGAVFTIELPISSRA